MAESNSYFNVLLGLGIGAVIGTAIFALSGSVDLLLAAVLMVAFSILGGAVGSQAPRIMRWLRPKAESFGKEASRRARVPPEQILNSWKSAWQEILASLPQEYRIDTRRLSSTAMIMVLADMAFDKLGLLPPAWSALKPQETQKRNSRSRRSSTATAAYQHVEGIRRR